MELRELRVVYGTQKSFYGKALIAYIDGDATLFSYGTEIAKAVDGGLLLTDDDEDDYTRTTMRHLNEFAQQVTRLGRIGIADIRKALDADNVLSVAD